MSGVPRDCQAQWRREKIRESEERTLLFTSPPARYSGSSFDRDWQESAILWARHYSSRKTVPWGREVRRKRRRDRRPRPRRKEWLEFLQRTSKKAQWQTLEADQERVKLRVSRNLQGATCAWDSAILTALSRSKRALLQIASGPRETGLQLLNEDGSATSERKRGTCVQHWCSVLLCSGWESPRHWDIQVRAR